MFSTSVLTGIIIVLVGLAAGRWFYSKDTEIENRRKRAIKVAGIYEAAGLVNVAEFLTNYAVGDYSGMAKAMDKAYNLLDTPGAAEKFLTDLKARMAAVPKPTE